MTLKPCQQFIVLATFNDLHPVHVDPDPEGEAMRTRIVIVGAWVLLSCVTASCGVGGQSAGPRRQAKPPPRRHRPSATMTPREVYKAAAPATIAIIGKRQDSYFGGTGIIYDRSRRLAVTNAHVVQGLTAIKIRFNDASTATARVLGRASCDDLAVLELSEIPKSARQLPLADSSRAEAADNVVALGYPASFQDFETEKVAFTSGTIQSAGVRAAPDPSLPEYPDTIQHSATINHGNSGGPLLNDRGQIIGINTLTNQGSAGQSVQGQYYAISSNHAKPLMQKLAAHKNIDYLGGDFVPLSEIRAIGLDQFYDDPAFAQMAETYLSENDVDGLVLDADPDPGSALDQRFSVGDLITHAQGTSVVSVSDLCAVLKSGGPGAKIRLGGRYISTVPEGHQFGDQWTDEVKIPG